MKIVSTGSTLSSPQFLEKKRRVRRRLQTLWILGIIAVLVIVIIVSRQERLLIVDVEVSGAKVVKEEAVIIRVKEILSGYYLGMMPKKNALIYPGGKVEEKLMKEFPRLSAVAASLDGLKLLRIDVAEREPFALYCTIVVTPEDASSCYFLDEESFIFDRAPLFSGAVYFIYSLAPALEEPLGKRFMSEEAFGALAQFVDDLPLLGLEPLAAEVGEEELTLILTGEARLRLRSKSNLDLIYSNLSAFLGDESIKAQSNFMQRVAELDLRTENKVFYSFR